MIKLFYKKNKGFSLVESLVYITITSMLLTLIASLVVNIVNSRKTLEASNALHQNARLIINFLNNQIHNVDLIDDVSPDPALLHFYQLPDTRFSLILDNGNLVYQETHDPGTGFPDQGSADPIVLNLNAITVSDLILTPVADGQGNLNQGVDLSFTLTIGNPGNQFGYLQKTFNTFISLR